MTFSSLGNFKSPRKGTLLNADFSIVDIPSCNCRLPLNPLPEKHSSEIIFTPCGIVMSPVRFLQFRKALFLISFSLSGRCRFPYSPEHPSKLLSPINSNDSGRISSPTNLQLVKVPLYQVDSNPLPSFLMLMEGIVNR